MEFDCKLAHLNKIEKISSFNSIQELYTKIGQAFSISPSDILFCTLNVHDYSDMNNLLGNYLSLSDLIIAHLYGKRKDLEIFKDKEYLGLTITDNGDGRAFVKKTKPGSSIDSLIKPGDHIEMINSKSMVGLRHHEVAKALKDITLNTVFSIKLVEPLPPTSDMISMYNQGNLHRNRSILQDIDQTINIAKPSSISSTPSPSSILSSTISSSLEDLAKSSLPIDRLLSVNRSNFLVSSQTFKNSSNSRQYLFDNRNKMIIDELNSLLESFLGIDDNELAVNIYQLIENENTKNVQDFMAAVKQSDLKIFDFSLDLMIDLWNCVAKHKPNQGPKNDRDSSPGQLI